MHELSIAQSVLSIAENAAPKGGAVVTGVRLQVGELSGVEIEALRFALSVIKKDTLLHKAVVDIEVVAGEAECSGCQAVFPIHSFGTSCPKCNSYSMKILKGRELRVKNILVEEEEPVVTWMVSGSF